MSLTQAQVDAMGFDERVIRGGCRLGLYQSPRTSAIQWDAAASSFWGERLWYLHEFPNTSPTTPPTRLYCGAQSATIADEMGVRVGLTRNTGESDHDFLGRCLPLSDAN